MKFWKLFAICPFWQPNRKQPPPHPALPYDATAGAPHSAESALSHGAAPRSLQTPHLHHPTAPRSRLFTPLHPYRSMMPGTHRPITPYPCLFATLHLCAPWRREHIDPRRRTCATPCCQAPRRSQYRARSASPPPRHCSRAAGSLETKKLQKRQDFCFRKANYRNRSRFRNEPIAKGKSRNELIAATRRTPMNNART